MKPYLDYSLKYYKNKLIKKFLFIFLYMYFAVKHRYEVKTYAGHAAKWSCETRLLDVHIKGF